MPQIGSGWNGQSRLEITGSFTEWNQTLQGKQKNWINGCLYFLSTIILGVVVNYRAPCILSDI
jgi:hypothetical protein